MNRLGIPWEGDLGVRSSFNYQGIFIVQKAPGDISSVYFCQTKTV